MWCQFGLGEAAERGVCKVWLHATYVCRPHSAAANALADKCQHLLLCVMAAACEAQPYLLDVGAVSWPSQRVLTQTLTAVADACSRLANLLCHSGSTEMHSCHASAVVVHPSAVYQQTVLCCAVPCSAVLCRACSWLLSVAIRNPKRGQQS